ncbi:MAG: DNA oxidative demethylase AlkB [Kordiimonadales bacterium]|nr:MAG: DNA oxidative demethylase AlkB [Kordiimonadales bacterium]
MEDLFAALRPEREDYGDGAVLFPGLADGTALLRKIKTVLERAPLRHLTTPGGHRMSVAMSNCGPLGWVSDRRGYRYSPSDPESGEQWPVMPELFKVFAAETAARAGFSGFEPDACLINQYAPGTSLSPHQDADECDMRWPIVSVSLGVPATYQLYGDKRGGKPKLIRLMHGDVFVLGGKARRFFHGIKKLETGDHPETGCYRYNLTFRRARP